MNFKPSAGLFVGGVTMSICGPILSSGCWFFASMAVVRGDQQMAMIFWIVAGVGALLGLVGSFVLIAAVHRALVKIDALPLEAARRYGEAPQRSGSSSVF
ncbi:hypothetical protein PV772_03565 [Pseudarthrobacter sp. CC12]|uniref:hypothetical protein n=1 Tax=Pseudarthrobacter sp. CC12 TaxID=3029193 RepID=UPI0032677562